MNNQDLKTKVERAGLTDKESATYSALIELGGAFPSKIAEYTKLNRSTVYKVLLDLSVKGLVSEIKKKNKLYYQIENPTRLVRYAKDKVKIAEEQLEYMSKLVPQIEGLYSLLSNKPKISYFENIDGILSIYEDQISGTKKYEMLAFSNTTEIENVFPKDFFTRYRRAKEKIGITTRGLIPDTERDESFVNRMYDGYKKEVIPQVKYVPAKDFPFKGEITIYGDKKVSIVNLNKEYFTGLIIEDQTIHNMMRMIFELSWKGVK